VTDSAAPRPSSGARYVLERADGQGQGELVYRGLVRLPEANVPIEVRISEATGAARAIVDAGAVPDGGPRPADLERTAAALVKSATKAASSGERLPPRKIVRWRG
jgi:hypothetical protein